MKINEKTLPLIALIFSIVFVIIILILSRGVFGSVDTIAHYHVARYAFRHPELFLHHWGKPLFTILSSPFAQLGYHGSVCFNLLCGLFTAWLIFKIADRLRYDYTWTVILMVIFTPIYFSNMFTSQTEIIFSLVLTGAIYLFLKEKYILSALVISLIPYARNEGLMFLVIFLLALIWMKRYRAVPFLAFGFIFFGLIGLPQYKDFWWFFTKMPYGKFGSELYGSGSFFYYLKNFNRIMGFPLILLALIGTGTMLKWFISARKLYRDVGWTTEYLLILPSFFGFIFVQSFLWWRGIFGVLASTRFMASVLPLGALIALAGFNVIINGLSFNRVTRNRIAAIILLLIMITPFIYNKIPFIPGGSFYAIEKATDWFKKSPYKNRYVYYFDPTVAFYLKEDPWVNDRVRLSHPHGSDPAKIFKDSSVIFWENNFGAFAEGISFDKLFYNPDFKLLNVFVPRKDFESAVKDYYMVAVFEKHPRDSVMNKFSLFRLCDFENNVPENKAKNLTDTSYTGKYAYKLEGSGFSPGWVLPVSDLPGNESLLLRVSGKFRLPEGFPEGRMILVLEIRNSKDRIYRYLTAKNSIDDKSGKWFEMSFLTAINKTGVKGGIIKVYAWNMSKTNGLVDDLKLEYYPISY